jgi:hypothetical protein
MDFWVWKNITHKSIPNGGVLSIFVKEEDEEIDGDDEYKSGFVKF